MQRSVLGTLLRARFLGILALLVGLLTTSIAAFQERGPSGETSKEDVASLLKKIDKTQPRDVRLKTLRRLAESSSKDNVLALPVLRLCLQEKDSEIRYGALDALGRIAFINKQPCPMEVVSALFDTDNTIRGCASNWIGAFADYSPQAVPLLLKGLQSGDHDMRSTLASSLGDLAVKNPAVLAALRKAAEDNRLVVRNNAQVSLWKCTKDFTAYVRFRLEVLWESVDGKPDRDADKDPPDLKERTKTTNNLIHLASMHQLDSFENERPRELAETLIKLLADKSSGIRALSARRLGKMTRLNAETFSVLEQLKVDQELLKRLNDPDLLVRAETKASLELFRSASLTRLFNPEVKQKLNRIQEENRKEGSLDWQLTRVKLDKTGGFRSPLIEGYCSRQSVQPGESLQIMVSTAPAARFKIEIFRTGYYGGRGARRMTTLGPFQGKEQPTPPVGPHRLRECKWESATDLKIPADWVSGVYLGRLSTIPDKESEPYWQSYVVFIVRDDRPADILFQCSDNTWQAYNRWPDNYSVYTDPKGTQGPWSHVSFDRPYAKYAQIYDNPQSIGSGEWLCFEFPMAFWLEKHGYDVSYCSNSDMLTPQRGLKCKALLSVGHDEYWDIRAYESVKAMRDAGVNVLFFSGNAVCWVTPQRPSSDGRPNRIMFRGGPYGGKYKYAVDREKQHGPFPERGPDEGYLIGARNVEPVNGGGDWICAMPDHGVFAKTGMKKGDRIPGLVGWEYHGDPPADLAGLEILAEGTAWQGGTRPQRWASTIYWGPKKSFVFNASTIFWSQGLSSPPGHMLPWSHWSRPHGPDERVQQITHNLLERALRTRKVVPD